MAVPSFEAVRPSHAKSHNQARKGVLALSACLAVVALIALSSSNEDEAVPQTQAQSGLYEVPGISLGIRAHEGAAPPAAAPAPKAAPAQSLAAPAAAHMDLSHHLAGRWNYQMDNTLTWPPHDTAYIPTGAYSAGYKGPYDNDYDWPDDTQVLRNDEWDQSGGVGCGMSGNNC
mmetsp:Transcript_67575/g.140858  ORF Transcript_67575/g.140858 Transcript_67575/m.140858 type:complete len:173 (+) Transcript_67575:38-556(+)